MTKYEAVRAKIVEACLDTMEIVEYCGWHDATNHHKCKDCIHVKSVLSLSHVLRAIVGKVDSTACMYPDGSFVEWDSSGDNYYTLFRYDLTKDDLSLQSTDTIDFLFNILCE